MTRARKMATRSSKPTLEDVKRVVMSIEIALQLAADLGVEVKAGAAWGGSQSWITASAAVDGIDVRKSITMHIDDTF